jgi:ATP-dependent Zn protease
VINAGENSDPQVKPAKYVINVKPTGAIYDSQKTNLRSCMDYKFSIRNIRKSKMNLQNKLVKDRIQKLEDKQESYKNWLVFAFLIIILIIGVWFFSHFRVSIIPVNTIDSVVNVTFYSCPGVGLQTDISHYLGCSIHHTEQKIDSKILKRGIVFYWI